MRQARDYHNRYNFTSRSHLFSFQWRLIHSRLSRDHYKCNPLCFLHTNTHCALDGNLGISKSQTLCKNVNATQTICCCYKGGPCLVIVERRGTTL